MTDLTPERRDALREYAAGIVGEMLALLDAADERDRLAAQVERVRALHVTDGEGFCRCCDYMTPHPCATLRALDGADDE